MPWLIYRYILKDMLKLLAISSVVLVLVISFAAAIKPLSEGLLGAQALIKYVLYLAPTMLGFILPFSGAFASTLVFSRLAGDNELVACRAAGIGYRTILIPVVFLGLVLTLGLFYLGNWVVPSFYRQAALMLEKDVVQVIVNQVQQQRPITLGDVVVYADAADDSQPPPVIPGDAVQPTKLIRLRGVAVGQLDDRGRLRSDSTAQKAEILLYRVDQQTWVTMHLENVVYYDAVRGDLVAIQQWSMPQVLLPSPLKDDPRFLSWPEVRRLREKPELYDRIKKVKQRLAGAIATERIFSQIRGAVLSQTADGAGGARLIGAHSQEVYVVDAPGVTRDGQTLSLESRGAAPVRVTYQKDGRITRRSEAKRATVWVEMADPQPEPWVRLQMHEARTYDPQAQRHGTEHTTVLLPRGRWATPVLEPLKQMHSTQLHALARQQHPDTKVVSEAAVMLRHQIVYLIDRRVEAQLHKRAALPVACMLLMVLGAVLGMKLGVAVPLVTYLWSFLSAVVVVVISNSGENLAAHPELSISTGLFVIWLGNLLLIFGVGGSYLWLARH